MFLSGNQQKGGVKFGASKKKTDWGTKREKTTNRLQLGRGIVQLYRIRFALLIPIQW